MRWTSLPPLVLLVACAGRPPAPDTPEAPPELSAPPDDPLRCPGGLDALAVDWSVTKADEPGQPAWVTVLLDGTKDCVVVVGELPRRCSYGPERRTLTCTDADGSREHRVRVESSAEAVEVHLDAPEGSSLLARLPPVP